MRLQVPLELDLGLGQKFQTEYAKKQQALQKKREEEQKKKEEKKKKKKKGKKKRTSIGHSNRSRPKNKHKRRTWKKYVGQGK